MASAPRASSSAPSATMVAGKRDGSRGGAVRAVPVGVTSGRNGGRGILAVAGRFSSGFFDAPPPARGPTRSCLATGTSRSLAYSSGSGVHSSSGSTAGSLPSASRSLSAGMSTVRACSSPPGLVGGVCSSSRSCFISRPT